MDDNINKFSDKAENYAKYRIGYPNEILKYLNSYGFNNYSIIADIGSGTGKLTKVFLDNNNTVYAVEPNDNMRNMANSLLSGFKNYIPINGTADNTTLQSGTIDFVVVGQAFHWFDASKALIEFKRILKNNGVLMLIWYSKKTDTPFLNEYENILESIPEYKIKSSENNISDDVIEKYYIKDYKKITLENNQELNFNELIGSFLSSSYTPKEGTNEYNKLYKLLENIFNKYKIDNKVIFKFEMKIYIGRI